MTGAPPARTPGGRAPAPTRGVRVPRRGVAQWSETYCQQAPRPDRAGGTGAGRAPAGRSGVQNMANGNQIVLDHTGFVGHGNTLAAWVTVGIMSVGVIVGVVGFTVGSTAVLIVGLGLIVVGLIAGWVLRSMGHGAGSEQRKHEARHHKA